MFIVIMFSFIPFLILSANQISSVKLSDISALTWLGVAFTGILGTCIGNILWYIGIQNLFERPLSAY